MHNPGPDREDGTADDVVAPLNSQPNSTAIDMRPGSGCGDNGDRVQNFASAHTSGAFFLLGDGSVQWVSENIDRALYQEMSTISSPRD